MKLAEIAAGLADYLSPKVVAQVNDQYLKVARVKGQLAWHTHDHEDELFIVLQGTLAIEYETETVVLETGDFHVVPKGVAHNPRCDEECLIALVETVTTEHTGGTVTEKTRSIAEQLGDFERPEA